MASGQTIAYIQGNSKARAGHTVYNIFVTNGGVSWSVQRRYNEFDDLHDIIESAGHMLPDMPSKSTFRKLFSSSFREQRQQSLASILANVIRIDPNLSLPCVRTFLSPLVRTFSQGSSESESECGSFLERTAPVATAYPQPVPSAPPAVRVHAQPFQAAYRAPQPGYVQPPPARPQPVYAQPVAQRPVYAQPVVQQPVYIQQPTYAQPVYDYDYAVYEERRSGVGMEGVALGVAGGLAAGVVGGMLLESALD